MITESQRVVLTGVPRSRSDAKLQELPSRTRDTYSSKNVHMIIAGVQVINIAHFQLGEATKLLLPEARTVTRHTLFLNMFSSASVDCQRVPNSRVKITNDGESMLAWV